MAFFRYDDVPGVIGRVGTTFGGGREHRQHGRVPLEPGNKALMARIHRQPRPARAGRRFLAAGFDDARFITLD